MDIPQPIINKKIATMSIKTVVAGFFGGFGRTDGTGSATLGGIIRGLRATGVVSR
jgi:hypothetical protein